MPKKSFQDIVKIKHINRDVLTERKIEKKEKIEKSEHKESHFNYHVEESNNSRYALWFVALVSVIFLLFAFSFLFSRAKVTVNPKVKDLELNETLSATKDSSVNGLSFQLISISDKETKIVPGGEEKDVSVKAKGVVTIFNTFSSAPQSLSIDTRLEGSNGKMYTTDAKIVVPGMAKDGTPGRVEVNISGKEAGSEYNSAPLDFKIFGFKGTSKYSKIYARSKSPITGGLKGKFGQISDTEKETIVNDLKTILQTKLFKKATEQIPSEYILFKDAVFFKTEDPTVDFIPAGGQVSIGIKGTLYGFFFNEKDLTKKIATSNIEDYDGSDVYVSKIKDLLFSLTNKETISFSDVKNINFTLKGDTKIVWRVENDKLVNDLLNTKKKDFNSIFSKYSNINSADLVLRPAWKSSLPDKKQKIDIIVNYP